MKRLGFVGFGEAAFHLAKGLGSEGVSGIVAYDVGLDTDLPYKETLLKRAGEACAGLASSLEELIDQSDVVVAAVPAKYTEETLRQILCFIRKDMLVVDVTTALPDIKERMEQAFSAEGAFYADSAMLGPLPVYAHRVPMLASGSGASKWHDLMTPFHMSITVVEGYAGNASRIKLVRSVFMKGLEALLTETFVFAHRCGIESVILDSISETMNKTTFQNTARRLLCADVIHSERRSFEVSEAIALMKEIGLESHVSEGVRKRLELTTQLEAAKKLGGIAPETLEEVFAIWDEGNYR